MSKYNSQHPNKKLECYPCNCPDCDGFHNCDYSHMKHGDIRKCNVCGKKYRFIPLTDADIESQLKLLKNSPKIEEHRRRMYDPENRRRSGKFITLKPAYK